MPTTASATWPGTTVTGWRTRSWVGADAEEPALDGGVAAVLVEDGQAVGVEGDDGGLAGLRGEGQLLAVALDHEAGGAPPPARIACCTSLPGPGGLAVDARRGRPGRMPAAAAGAAGSPGPHSVSGGASTGRMHSETVPMVVVVCIAPKPTATTASRTVARTRFITGPPSMTTSFCQTLRL